MRTDYLDFRGNQGNRRGAYQHQGNRRRPLSNSASTVCLENLSVELSRLGRLSLNGFVFGGFCLGGLLGFGILLSLGGPLSLGGSDISRCATPFSLPDIASSFLCVRC